MNRLLILSLLFGGALVSCSGEETTDTTVDADLEVISEEAADAAAEGAIKTEDDAKSALEQLEKDLDG